MKALVFRHSLAREAASAIGGRIDRRAFVSRFAPVRIEDVEEQPLPAEDWVRVETTFSGPGMPHWPGSEAPWPTRTFDTNPDS